MNRARLTVDKAEMMVDALIPIPRIKAADIANRLGVSRSVLFALFHEHGGIERYIIGKRLRNAATALQRSDNTANIGDLAQQLGFCDAGHFSRAFRAHYGVTPSAYRRAHHDRETAPKRIDVLPITCSRG